MSSNVSAPEKNSSAENDLLSEKQSANGIDIRVEEESHGDKSDGAISSKNLSADSELKGSPHRLSTSDLHVSNVSSSGSSGKCSDFYALQPSLSGSKISERVKRKSWYNVIYPSYKSRSESFKKLFKEVPDDQRLIVDYSCALQREILVHGRMFVSQHYMCFHANIFGWETYLSLKWRNVTGITKEKTALVIPNAILITTDQEKYFITSFAARDKTYLMLFRIWQNALMNKSMLPQEIWQCVHNAYGEQLGLTSDDEDYIDPSNNGKSKDVNLGVDSKKITSSDIETDQSIDKKPSTKLITVSDAVSARSSQVKRMRSKGDNDNIPTDASASTDSEDENSVPFVSTAECTSMHEGRQLVHTILPINVDSLLTLLFSKSKFFAEFHNLRKTTNIVYRDWVKNDDGTQCRTVNLTVAVTQAVGPKTSNVTEVQVMRDCSVNGELYSIDTTSTNAGIPYADSFHIITHYCLMRTVDDHTMLSVYAQIKYTKSVWGVVKGFIEKNVWNGLEDFYKSLLNALQSEYCIPPAKSKSRRTKRALTQKLSIEEAPAKSRLAQKSTSKSSPVSVAPQSPLTLFKRCSLMRKDPSIEQTSSLPSQRTFFTFDMFSIFVMILIIALVLLNIVLLIQLYLIKKQHAAEISINKVQFEKLAAISDPNELRQSWLNLLNQQKTLHEAELEKWQGFVRAAVDLLQKIKDIYSKFSVDLKNVDDTVVKDEF